MILHKHNSFPLEQIHSTYSRAPKLCWSVWLDWAINESFERPWWKYILKNSPIICQLFGLIWKTSVTRFFGKIWSAFYANIWSHWGSWTLCSFRWDLWPQNNKKLFYSNSICVDGHCGSVRNSVTRLDPCEMTILKFKILFC